MYRHQITIELSDDIVHKHSIMEWEAVLLADGVIERDELPLSYGRIAEIIAVQLYKYRHVQGITDDEWKCAEDTTYINDKGFSTNVRVTPVPGTMYGIRPHKPMTLDEAEQARMLAEAGPLIDVNTMQIGISNYGRKES